MIDESETKKRKNMFYIRCKCNGKVWNVIVDSGSTNNLVSKEMVDKLKLERKTHLNLYRIAWLERKKRLNPYQIAWLQKDHKALVNENI